MTSPWSQPDPVVLRRASLRYDGAAHFALRDVDLRITPGELVAVIGRTGSGKSSLLGLLTGLVPHFSGGQVSGSVQICGRDLRTHRPSDFAGIVGHVGQNPVTGFVADTVEDELAYGMEQLGLAPAVMRRRIEETLDVLGIADLRDALLRELSGGQQQRVAIGSVLVTHPHLLVLDEPTSALDPTAAEDVLGSLTRLVQDVGVSVVVAEHRIERVLPFADQVVHVGAGGSVSCGAPADILEHSDVAPPLVELGRAADWRPLPLTVRDARRRLPARVDIPSGLRQEERLMAEPVLLADRVRVTRGGVDVVRGAELILAPGQVTALMGRNGCGKTSLLWALQGSGARTGGNVRVGGVDPASLPAPRRRALVGMVPQNASDLLYLETVGAELAQADRDADAPSGTASAVLDRCAPGIHRDLHPRDLSEGQRLSLVLAIQLAARPEVLLLDEPTRGLDYAGKAALTEVLVDRAADGCAVLVATHDVEFAARTANTVIAMAGGEIIADGPAASVLAASPALAPQVTKVLAPVAALTVDDARRVLGLAS